MLTGLKTKKMNFEADFKSRELLTTIFHEKRKMNPEFFSRSFFLLFWIHKIRDFLSSLLGVKLKLYFI